jgi:DNA polymerase III delta prime subunit
LREGRHRKDASTSRHLRRLVDHAQAGAHVVLRGNLGDDVLVEGELAVWSRGIAQVLVDELGTDYVFVANQADGVYCLDEDRADSAGEFFAELRRAEPADESPQLGEGEARNVAAAIRLLLRQEERLVAVLLEDPSAMFAVQDGQTRGALGVLVEAMREAAHPTGQGSSFRNLLIVHGSPDGPAVTALAELADARELTAEHPSFEERQVALHDLRRSFHRGADGGKPSDDDLETLARLTDGESMRGLVQLSSTSRATETPADRPETLYRVARGESAGTPLGRIGVQTIMERIRNEVLGQDESLDKLQKRLQLGAWRPANRPPGASLTRPMATVVFHGPPGVGKTETALILAEALLGSRSALHRIDCSEMVGRHSIARLVGAPPGYVGHEAGGALSEVLEREAAVILFDEFDRADGLAETLLGILDAGRLTDGRGHTASFENAVLIFTTNLGFREGEEAVTAAAQGLSREEFIETSEGRVKEEITKGKLKSPALWSRLQDAMIGFDRLHHHPGTLEEIVDSACRRLQTNLGDEYGIELRLLRDEFLPAVAAELGAHWDGRRAFTAIQSQVELPARKRLTEMQDARRLQPGGALVLGCDDAGEAVPRRGRVAGRR